MEHWLHIILSLKQLLCCYSSLPLLVKARFWLVKSCMGEIEKTNPFHIIATLEASDSV